MSKTSANEMMSGSADDLKDRISGHFATLIRVGLRAWVKRSYDV